jgi:hypothetical protein
MWVPPFGYLWILRLHTGSPELFAVCHALLRLLAPRHPPYALSSLTHNETTKLFFAFYSAVKVPSSSGISPVAVPDSRPTHRPMPYPPRTKKRPVYRGRFTRPLWYTLVPALFAFAHRVLLPQTRS